MGGGYSTFSLLMQILVLPAFFTSSLTLLRSSAFTYRPNRSLLPYRLFSSINSLDLVSIRENMSLKKHGQKTHKEPTNNTQSKKQQKKLLQFQAATQTQINIFNRYYIEQYGQERWERLMEALQKPVKYVAMLNQYADRDFAMKLLKIYEGETVPFLPEYFHDIYIHKNHAHATGVGKGGSFIDEDEITNDTLWPTPGATTSLDSRGLCVYYPFDAASLLPVLLLDIQPQHRVIDLCSAPGGKALATLQRFASFYPNEDVIQSCQNTLTKGSPTLLTSSNEVLEVPQNVFTKGISTATKEIKKPIGPKDDNSDSEDEMNQSSTEIKSLEHSLICNDVSPDRRIRLKNVMRRYLPRSLSDQIDVFNGDATQRRFLQQFTGHFDRILLDVPCSSERHLIYDFVNTPLQSSATAPPSGNSLLTWAAGRNKANAERQVILLQNSLSLLAMHGKLVYSTCALNQNENDEVIGKVLKKLESTNIKISEGKAEGERFSLKVQRRSASPTDDALVYAGVKMPFGEATEYGWHILPDVSDGWGPIYLAVLEKIPYDPALNTFTNEKDAKKLMKKVKKGSDDDSSEGSNSGSEL